MTWRRKQRQRAGGPFSRRLRGSLINMTPFVRARAAHLQRAWRHPVGTDAGGNWAWQTRRRGRQSFRHRSKHGGRSSGDPQAGIVHQLRGQDHSRGVPHQSGRATAPKGNRGNGCGIRALSSRGLLEPARDHFASRAHGPPPACGSLSPTLACCRSLFLSPSLPLSFLSKGGG
jgi:hypothetical protein